MTTPSTDHGSGKAQLTITKDTTLKISLVVLVSVVSFAGVGVWQFLELRGAERDRVNLMVSSTNANVAQLSAAIHQQLSELKADLNYTTRTFEGYKSRFDRVDDSLQELRLIRHRIEQLEQSGAPQERRTHALESRIEEIFRILAELRVTTEYLMRWLNPPGTDPPRKRSDRFTAPDGATENIAQETDELPRCRAD